MKMLRGRLVVFLLLILGATCASAETSQVRLLKGTGGIGFLQLYIMEQQKTVEKYAAEMGIKDLKVSYLNMGGPAVGNDALLSGAADMVPAGPPGFITMWDRTRTSSRVMGVSAMASIPMVLNSRNPKVKNIRDISSADKIGVIAVKVSVYSLILQMAARKEFGPEHTFDLDKYTVGIQHADGVAGLLSGGEMDMHFTGSPFSDRELKDPRVKTVLNSDDVMGGSTTFTMLYTTTKFHDENPIIYKAIVRAVKDATDYINQDKERAAKMYIDSVGGKRDSLPEVAAMFKDPKNVFTTSPQNVFKYASFMHSIGSIKNQPASWKDLFFPEIHAQPGG